MSRAKKTKAAKRRAVIGLYRHVGELLNQKPKPKDKNGDTPNDNQ